MFLAGRYIRKTLRSPVCISSIIEVYSGELPKGKTSTIKVSTKEEAKKEIRFQRLADLFLQRHVTFRGWAFWMTKSKDHGWWFSLIPRHHYDFGEWCPNLTSPK